MSPKIRKEAASDETSLEKPKPGYLDRKQLKKGVLSLRKYLKTGQTFDSSNNTKKDLLEADKDDAVSSGKVIVEVVFKNIPSNSRTYVHNVILPNHWRWELEPEDYNIAVFVRHRRPETEAQKIQFSRDRDLDIDNTHSYYQDLFRDRLDDSLRSRISRIISVKELATEFNTFQRLDRLSKTYDLFLADKQLMANKMNPLPRRLGRRFWVREKKVPLMIKLDGKDLNERFQRVLSTEPFYVIGSSSTEQIQVGIMSQTNDELVGNLAAFLKKLYHLYRDNVRFIRLKTVRGIALPLYADLSVTANEVVMRKKKVKLTPVVDDFDMLEGDAKISVHPDGTVKVLRPKRKREEANSSKSAKKIKS